MNNSLSNLDRSRFSRYGPRWSSGVFACCILTLAGFAHAADSLPTFPMVTNVVQIDRLAARTPHATLAVNLEGAVRWAAADGTLLVFEDASGAAIVETEPQTPPFAPGQLARVTGDASVNGYGAGVRLGQRLLVDIDGVHEFMEKSAPIHLPAGKHPLSVAWLAGGGAADLQVSFHGPGLPRQKLPDQVLFRAIHEPDSGAIGWQPGLAYQIFSGQWPCLPDFDLAPVQSGVTNNFDLGVTAENRNVALRFSGWVEVPHPGDYIFSLGSSGGSQLFLGRPRIEIIGMAALPAPRRFKLGEALPPGTESAWVETEGVVTFISPQGPGDFQMELRSEAERLRLEIKNGTGLSREALLGSRVRVSGVLRTAYALDGQPAAGVLWVPGKDQVTMLEAAKHGRIENANSAAGGLPTLTSLGQIMQLTREEVMRGYPVKIQAVITWSGRTACHIQDATAGIYTDFREAAAGDSSLQPRVGEFWEFAGTTELRFSPVIVAQKARRLGLGMLPEPVHPAMDQLLNGSLDGQYVELQGMVTAIHTNRLTLLTSGDTIQVYLVPPMWDGEPSVLATNAGIQEDWSGRHLAALQTYQGALIRVRGSLSPVKSRETLQFKVGEIQIRAGSISVDRPPAADPFDAPAKRASELLMFDVQATAFQSVKVSGQIVQEHAGEFFLMDGNQGLRFIPHQPVTAAPGDLVEVAGYPKLGGPVPVLREASVRKIGHAELPQPQRLLSDSPLILNNAGYDSTRVELKARLVNSSDEHNDQVLELQMGSHFFVARLDKKYGSASAIPVGSLLDLTGVYAGHVSAPGQGIDSFELLLNSPSDIQVLSRPSWWTLKRLAAVVGVLAGLVVAASVWISLLRRQVEQRTTQLRQEIHEREHAEQLHAIEAERSRIARDLHDDLGSSLTEISLLADAGPGSPPTLDKAGNRFQFISEKARALVNALDVIVWLVNPKKDSLPLLASYLGGYAEEFLSASAIACRLKIPLDLPPTPLSAETRHGIFLAVKETLNNAASHAQAGEVTFELSMKNNELNITISDNGRGFDPTAVSGGNGLQNLRDRMARLGGRCQINSAPGKGTVVMLALPI